MKANQAPRQYIDDDWGEVVIMVGTVYTLTNETSDFDRAAAVRKIAEEVTGKSFTPPKPRMGFL